MIRMWRITGFDPIWLTKYGRLFSDWGYKKYANLHCGDYKLLFVSKSLGEKRTYTNQQGFICHAQELGTSLSIRTRQNF